MIAMETDARLSSEVHLWITATDPPLSAPQSARFLAWLDAEERSTFQRLRFAPDRARYLLSHAALRLTLSRYAPVPPEQWKFTRGAGGRPELSGPVEAAPLRFSLSRRPGLVACMVSNGPDVGADVEQIETAGSAMDVARRFFAATEVRDLERCDDPGRGRLFGALWALKEAYLKARGAGLTLPLDQVAFQVGQAGRIQPWFGPAMADDPASWRFALFWPTPRHAVAAAWRCTPPRDRQPRAWRFAFDQDDVTPLEVHDG